MTREKWGLRVRSEAVGARRTPRAVLALVAAASLVALGLGVTSASAVEPKVVVQGKADSTTSLDVSWTDVKGATAYRVAYSTDQDLKKKVQTLADVQKGTDATITGLDSDKTYFVRVTALDGKGGTVGDSAVVAAATKYVYPAPGDIYATKVTDTSMTLSWKSVGKTPGYIVSTSIKDKPTIETSSTSVNLTGLKASTKYDFKVEAGKGGEPLSDDSPSQSFTTSEFPIAAPDDLTQAKQGSTTINLTWDKVAGLADDQGYVVEWSESTTFTKSKTTDTVSGTSTQLKGLDNDQTYYARTWVVDAKGKRISNRSDYIVLKTRVPRGTLEGDVSGPTDMLEAVAYDSTGQAAVTVPVSGGGHYKLDVRPGKGYKVQVVYVGPPPKNKGDDDHNWVSTFAHSKGTGWTISEGTTYSVDEGENQKVDDINVKHGNIVDGNVLFGKNADTDGIRDVDVTAISGEDQTNAKAEREVIGMARTGANQTDKTKYGYFLIGGLPDGEYWFRYHYVGSGKGYDTLSQHLKVEEDLGLKVTLKKS
jgi:Fibronectin type III domain